MEMSFGDVCHVHVFVDMRFHQETCPRGVGMAHDSFKRAPGLGRLLCIRHPTTHDDDRLIGLTTFSLR